MEPVEVVEAPKKPRDGFSLAGKVVITVVVGTLLSVAVWQAWRADRLEKENAGYVATILDLKAKMLDIIATGNKYKSQRDSAFAVSDSAVAKLSYAQKIAKILQGLLDNKTLSPADAAKNPSLTDERVVTANLKTIEHERILRLKGDTLYNALGALNTQILDFKTDNLTLKYGLVGIQAKAQANISGGVWPLNRKRRRQNKEIAQQAAQVISSVEPKQTSAIAPVPADPKATSDLEDALNKPR